jgi:ribosomal protein S12 methylthiotransferase
MRGKLRSRPIGMVLREAEQLAARGVKELLVISQDTSAYGVDLGYQPDYWQDRQIETRLFDLASELGKLGIWVRLHYVYPYPHVDRVIPLMAEGSILPYLDIPFQHASRRVLKAMRRPAAAENTLKRIEQWRADCPELTLRSTFIVGFPGETEAEFEELLDWLRKARLDRVGCFTYSPVDGARANALDNPVPEELKQERWHRFMQAQAEISAERLQNRIGALETVLVDQVEADHAIARSRSDAPEIDGQVIIEDAGHLSAGDWAEVIVHGADNYDLFARIAAPGEL